MVRRKKKRFHTDNEVRIAAQTLITSKTDLHGYITYCNEDVIHSSGYTEKELFMQPHSIIRHPDMPRTVFKLLWDYVQNGKEIFAYVKNLSKTGSFYWVFANITPSYDANNNIIGYYSVRRQPTAIGIQTADGLYKEMLKIEETEGMEGGEAYLNNVLKSLKKPYNQVIYELQYKGQ